MAIWPGMAGGAVIFLTHWAWQYHVEGQVISHILTSIKIPAVPVL
jgi:hypothetical protein